MAARETRHGGAWRASDSVLAGQLELPEDTHTRHPDQVFDYSSMPEEIAREAQSIVADARALHQRTVEGLAEIGRRLNAIRDRLGHGQFLKWVEVEFGSKSSAYRAIDVASTLADELPTVGSLPLTVI